MAFLRRMWRGFLAWCRRKNEEFPFQRFKIVGYDGNEITRLVSPQVTTIAQNTKKLAETCVDVLNKIISGLDTEDRYFVPVKIDGWNDIISFDKIFVYNL